MIPSIWYQKDFSCKCKITNIKKDIKNNNINKLKYELEKCNNFWFETETEINCKKKL